jgi:hypothetical protein
MEAHRVLGVARDASEEQVRRAYKALVSRSAIFSFFLNSTNHGFFLRQWYGILIVDLKNKKQQQRNSSKYVNMNPGKKTLLTASNFRSTRQAGLCFATYAGGVGHQQLEPLHHQIPPHPLPENRLPHCQNLLLVAQANSLPGPKHSASWNRNLHLPYLPQIATIVATFLPTALWLRTLRLYPRRTPAPPLAQDRQPHSSLHATD